MAGLGPYVRPVLVAAGQAAAKAGLTLYDEHKAELITWAESLTTGDLKGAMDALAAHITLNGFASVMQTPARNAVTGSETTVAEILDSNIEGAAAWVDTWLGKIASGQAA